MREWKVTPAGSSAGGAEESSPARERWVDGKNPASPVGATRQHRSGIWQLKSKGKQVFSCCTPAQHDHVSPLRGFFLPRLLTQALRPGRNSSAPPALDSGDAEFSKTRRSFSFAADRRWPTCLPKIFYNNVRYLNTEEFCSTGCSTKSCFLTFLRSVFFVTSRFAPRSRV